MADNRVLEITNGTSTVKFNAVGADHWLLEQGGYPAVRYGEAHITGNDPISGHTIFQAFRLASESADMDTMRAKVDTLISLLRQAVHYKEKPWEGTPVWIKSQGRTETNPRYAIVHRAVEAEFPSEFHKPLDLIHWATNVGIVIEREHPWSGNIPNVLPSSLVLTQTQPNGPATPTIHQVANYRDDTELTHIFNWDQDAAAFSGNLVNDANFKPFVVAGSTPALFDYIVFGSTDNPPRVITIPIGTAGVFDVGLDLSISDGAAGWIALTRGTDYWAVPNTTENSIFTSTGETVLVIVVPATWGKDAINAVNAYWLQIQIGAWTSWTTDAETNAKCYLANKNYIDIPSTQLLGDQPLPMLFRCFSDNGTEGGASAANASTLSKVLFGARSRNIAADQFECFLNAGNVDNPAAWAVTYGDDTTGAALVPWPGGSAATCTFATNTNMVKRVIYTGTAMVQYNRGRFELLVGVRRTTAGDPGDHNLQARIGVGSGDDDPHFETVSQPVNMDQANVEIVSLGEITVPAADWLDADPTPVTNLVIEILADRQAGASSLRFSGIWLLPIDEWAGSLEDPLADLDYGASAMAARNTTDFDGGVLHRGARQYYSLGNPLTGLAGWDRSIVHRYNHGGELPLLEPGKTTRIYLVMMSYKTDWGVGSLLGRFESHLGLSAYSKPGYMWLRGAD